MTPKTTEAAIQEAGLKGVSAPSCSVAGEEVDTGQEAKCFADYMRIHTLEGTGGKTYAQMPQFATEDGAGTSEADQAQKNPDGSPMSNPARQIWVTETALKTALYTSAFAEGVALFAIVVGVTMLLVGIGFLVLTVFARRRASEPAAAGRARPSRPGRAAKRRLTVSAAEAWSSSMTCGSSRPNTKASAAIASAGLSDGTTMAATRMQRLCR